MNINMWNAKRNLRRRLKYLRKGGWCAEGLRTNLMLREVLASSARGPWAFALVYEREMGRSAKDVNTMACIVEKHIPLVRAAVAAFEGKWLWNDSHNRDGKEVREREDVDRVLASLKSAIARTWWRWDYYPIPASRAEMGWGNSDNEGIFAAQVFVEMLYEYLRA